MKTSNIIPMNRKALQRGCSTKTNIKPTKYIRLAGQPKPRNRLEFAGLCYA